MSAKKAKDKPAPEPGPEIIDLGPESVVDLNAPPAEPQRMPEIEPETERVPEPEMGTESAPQPQPDSVPPPFTRRPVSPRQRLTSLWLPAAALLAGAILGGWFYRDWLISYFPPPRIEELAAQVAAAEQQSLDSKQQLADLTSKSTELQSTSSELQSQVTQATATTKQSVKSLETRLSVSESATAKQIAELKAALARQPAATGTGAGANPAELEALTTRVAKLEQDLASLSSVQVTSGESAVLSRTFAALQARALSGAPYTDEMAAFEAVTVLFEGLGILKANAPAGVPAPADLAKALDAGPLPTAEAPAEEKGYVDSFLGLFEGLITVKRIGAGDQVQLSKTVAALAASGQLGEALKQLDSQSAALPPELEAWRTKAQARLAVEQALERASASVLRQLVSKG
jgi:hypothetical protein